MDHNMETADLMILRSIRKIELGKVKEGVQDLEKVARKSKATFLSLQCRMKKLKEELAASNKEKEELKRLVANLEKSEAQASQKILQLKTLLDATQM